MYGRCFVAQWRIGSVGLRTGRRVDVGDALWRIREHLRLARGGLDKQTAILPLMGRLKIDVLDVDLAPNSTPILVGRQAPDLGALAIPIPRRESTCCACSR